MITLEQKKQLQLDAGIPHLPTDLTYECRMAISGEGSRAQDWSDKPHRLVYDLSRQVEADADRIEQLERELNKLREPFSTLSTLLGETEIQLEEAQAKLTKAVEGIKAMMEITMYPDEVWDKGNVTLAELEGGK